MSASTPRGSAVSPRWPTLLPCLVCLALNGFVAWVIQSNRPEYLRDARLNPNPDARHYVLLGRNVFLLGEYSRCAEPPYVPDVLRTPVYPLIAGGLDLAAGGVWGVYAFQVGCQVLLTVLVTRFALSLGFSALAVCAAGLVVAADLTLAVLNFEAMSESTYLLLSAAATYGFLWLSLRDPSAPFPWACAMGTGGVLGAAILTRPAGLYLPIVFLLASLPRAAAARSLRPLTAVLVGCLVSAACFGPWIARNQLVFGLPKLTNTDSITLAYFSAAGAYAVEHGCTREEAQVRIEEEFDLPSVGEVHNHWMSDRSVAATNADLREAGRAVIHRYPAAWARSAAMGIAKSLVSNSVGFLSEMSGLSWTPPGLDNAVRLNFGEFFQRLRENPLPLILSFCYQLAFAPAVLLLAAAGAFRGVLRPGSRWIVVFVVFVIAYYIATIALVGLDAYARHRAVLAPLHALLVACLFSAPRTSKSPLK